MWKDFNTSFKGILDDLARHKQLLIEKSGTIHLAESQRDSQTLHRFIAGYDKDATELRTHVRQYERDAEEVRSYIQQYELDRRSRLEAAAQATKEVAQSKLDKVRQWISPTSMSDLHESFRLARSTCPGSGEWILRSEKLEGWKDSDIPTNSTLWLHGIPGAGTFMVSVLFISGTRS